MNKSKIFAANLLIFLILLFFVIVGPTFFVQIKRFLLPPSLSVNTEDSLLEVYSDLPSIAGPLAESQYLEMSYADYYVWRRKPYAGKYININEHGIRFSSPPGSESLNILGYDKALFLGGSTMFGYGSSDENTIPSLFANETGIESVNLGETGYVARQSLNFFMSFLSSNNSSLSNSLVISYDGANDVGHGCRSFIQRDETGYEKLIKSALVQFRNQDLYAIERLFKPFQDAFGRLLFGKQLEELDVNDFNCSTSRQKAESVARNILDSWAYMNAITKESGGKFYAVLQPLAFYGSPTKSNIHISEVNPLRNEIEAVYPIVLKLAKEYDFTILDLTRVLDGEAGSFYFDFCHVSKDGNLLIAKEIISKVSKL